MNAPVPVPKVVETPALKTRLVIDKQYDTSAPDEVARERNAALMAPPKVEVPTQPTTPMYDRGLADRTAYEKWIAGTSGNVRAGAEYWAGQRSLAQPGACDGSPEFVAGCTQAKERLTPTDVLRKSQPDYKLGWNAYGR